MVDQRVRQAEPAGQQVEIAALGARVRIDRQPRSRVELDLLRVGLRRRDQLVEIDSGFSSSALQELLRLGADAGQRQLVADLLALVLVDMAVGLGGGDHGAHQRQREFGLALRRLRRDGSRCPRAAAASSGCAVGAAGSAGLSPFL